MRLTKDSRKLARQLYQASLVGGRLQPDHLRRAIALVVEQKPRNYMGVLKEIQRLVRFEAARHHAIVESAVELSEDALNRVIDDLRSRYGSDLTSEAHIVPELLGGLRIQIGNDVFDGSVKGRLLALEKQLAA